MSDGDARDGLASDGPARDGRLDGSVPGRGVFGRRSRDGPADVGGASGDGAGSVETLGEWFPETWKRREMEEARVQHSAVFFGGVVLGGVLSAACGFDLYDAGGDEIGAMRGHLEKARVELRLARDDRGRLAEREAHLRREIELLDSDREVLGERVEESAERVEVLAKERATLASELEQTRLAASLDRARSEAYEAELERLLVRHFTIPRPDSDRDLVLEFLERDGTLESTVELIRLLSVHSPEILLSLNCRPAARRSLDRCLFAEPRPELPEARLEPASARVNSARLNSARLNRDAP